MFIVQTGVSPPFNQIALPDSSPMAQPHKGDRALVNARLPLPVFEAVKRTAAERGIPMSQYVADVMALHFGRPDLVRQLDQEVLPQSA
jgi:predicted DNA binding CopG/RHH family protein